MSDDFDMQTGGDIAESDDDLEGKITEADKEGREKLGSVFRTAEGWNWLHEEAPEPTPLLTLDSDPWLPRSKVGMVVAPGGTGKTTALLQLAIAVATGRDWLDTFTVEKPGHVICALAETTRRDYQRMLKNASEELDLETEDKAKIDKRLWPIPLAGRSVGLMQDPMHELKRLQWEGDDIPDDVDELYYTDRRDDWKNELTDNAPEDGWRLIILDPASRFIGPDVEKDNAAATFFTELLEDWKNIDELQDSDGIGPTILLSHHTNKTMTGNPLKMLNTQGAARGSSALTDGVRWQLNMHEAYEKQSETTYRKIVGMNRPMSNQTDDKDMQWLKREDSRFLNPIDNDWPDGEIMGNDGVAKKQKEGTFERNDSKSASPQKSDRDL